MSSVLRSIKPGRRGLKLAAGVTAALAVGRFVYADVHIVLLSKTISTNAGEPVSL